MQNNTNPLEGLSNQDLERMYPELYQKLKPYIEDIASQLRNQTIDQNMIDSIIQEILRNSGLSTAPGTPSMPSTPSVPGTPGGTCAPDGTCPTDIMYDDFDDMDAVQVQRWMNYGNINRGYPRSQYSYPNYNRRRRYPTYPVYPIYPQYSNVNPQDLVRILLLRQLFGYNPYY